MLIPFTDSKRLEFLLMRPKHKMIWGRSKIQNGIFAVSTTMNACLEKERCGDENQILVRTHTENIQWHSMILADTSPKR